MSASKVAFARTMVLVLTYLVDFSVAVKLDTRAMTVVKASDLHRTWNPRILTFSFSETVVKRCHIVCWLVSRASKRSDLYLGGLYMNRNKNNIKSSSKQAADLVQLQNVTINRIHFNTS